MTDGAGIGPRAAKAPRIAMLRFHGDYPRAVTPCPQLWLPGTERTSHSVRARNWNQPRHVCLRDNIGATHAHTITGMGVARVKDNRLI